MGYTARNAAEANIIGVTSGSVLFINSSLQAAEDNANFFWDATNHRLGLGTTSPGFLLTVNGSAQIGAAASSVGFFGATPVVQIAAATDVVEGLIALGLFAEGENWPLNLGTGALTAGAATLGATTTTTISASGQMLEADGSVSAPAYSFTSQTGTGIFRTSGVLNLAVNGGTVLAASAAGQVQIPTTGASAGLLIGGDVSFFRSAASVGAFGTDVGSQWTGSAAANRLIQAQVAADTNQRFGVQAGGTIQWGPGNAALDTSLSRNGVNSLTIGTAAFSCGPLSIGDGADLVFATATGSRIGTGTTQKLSFYGATPIVQRSGAAQAAVATTASSQVTPFGYTTGSQADGIVTLLNELRASLVALGLIKGSA
jgi:hypothetical protein